MMTCYRVIYMTLYDIYMTHAIVCRDIHVTLVKEDEVMNLREKYGRN